MGLNPRPPTTPPPTLPPRGRPQPTARPRRPVCLSRLTTDLRRGPRPPAPLSLAGPRGCLMLRGGSVPDKHDVSRKPPPCLCPSPGLRAPTSQNRASALPSCRQAGDWPRAANTPSGRWLVGGSGGCGGCLVCTWCDLAALPPPPLTPPPATPLRGYLVDPASSICLSQRLSHASLSTHGRYSETANGSLNQLWFL